MNWVGHPKSIAAVLLESESHRVLIDPGPESSLATLREQLRQRGIAISDLHAILLTHIHLDHGGATGKLVRENPNLKVYVHASGARHMADPSKLLASAARLWGRSALRTLRRNAASPTRKSAYPRRRRKADARRAQTRRRLHTRPRLPPRHILRRRRRRSLHRRRRRNPHR